MDIDGVAHVLLSQCTHRPPRSPEIYCNRAVSNKIDAEPFVKDGESYVCTVTVALKVSEVYDYMKTNRIELEEKGDMSGLIEEYYKNHPFYIAVDSQGQSFNLEKKDVTFVKTNEGHKLAEILTKLGPEEVIYDEQSNRLALKDEILAVREHFENFMRTGEMFYSTKERLTIDLSDSKNSSDPPADPL